MDTLRRLIAWERRMGPPANRLMVRFYEWTFVVIGPLAIAFGVFALAHGFWWQGCGITLLGVWFTWMGWKRLVRFVRSHLGREHTLTAEGSEAVESTSGDFRPTGSRSVRLLGGSVLIAAGALIIVATLAH